MSDYYNPDGVVDDEVNTRKIIVRFATKEDFDKFVKTSGLSITNKTTELALPQHKALSELFDI